MQDNEDKTEFLVYEDEVYKDGRYLKVEVKENKTFILVK